MRATYWIGLMAWFMALSTSLFAHEHKHGSSKYEFVSNKGQWQSSINYRCKIPSGELLFENNRLVYNFLDFSPITNGHANPDHVEPANGKLKGHCFFLNFVGSNPVQSTASHKKEHYYNYFIGNDSSKWASKVPAYEELRKTELYQGIDLISRSENGKLKFEFEVSPESDPNQIILEYDGLEKLKVKNGELYLYTSLGQIIEEKPYTFQMINGEKREIDCSYVLEGNQISFQLGDYDPNHLLIIDPTLIFSTYSGSTSDNFGFTATYDSKGYLYSGSIFFGTNSGYPTTPGAYSRFYNGGFVGTSGVDIAISKYDTNGSKFIYSTYLGGRNNEMPHSLVVNEFGELYVFGTTGSKNFPTHSKAPQDTMNNPSSSNWHAMTGMVVQYNQGCDLFITKFNSLGSQLLGSTYLGGSDNDGISDTAHIPSMTLRYNYADQVRGEIDLDGDGNVYIASCTKSADFPTPNAAYDTTFNGRQDAVVIKLDGNLDSIHWSTYIGGEDLDAAYSLSFDTRQDVFIAGGTRSKDTSMFPTGSHPNHLNYAGGRADGFITKLHRNGSQVLSSTYLGTYTYDQIYFVELDRKNFVHVYGQTEDSSNYFIKNALYSKARQGVFVTKLTSSLDSILWSTTIGNHSFDATTGASRPQLSPTAFLVDVCNSIYLAGWGGRTNNASIGYTNNLSGSVTGLDTTSDAYRGTTDGSDFYLCSISSDASSLQYGSFFGGNSSSEHVDGGTSRFDKKGIIYQSVCAGCGGNDDFPIYPKGQVVSDLNGSSNCNNGVFKMNFKPPAVIAEFELPQEICFRDSFQLINNSKEMSASQYVWFFGNGDTSRQKSPKVYYDSIGTYTITLAILDTASCNSFDTISKTVRVVLPNPPTRLTSDTICQGDSTILGIVLNPTNEFTWLPGYALDDSTKMRPKATPLTSIDYLLRSDNGVCVDTFYQFIQVDSVLKAVTTTPDSICTPDSVQLVNQSSATSTTSYSWLIPGIDTTSNPNPKIEITQKGIYTAVLIIADPLTCNKFDTTITTIEAYGDTSYTLDQMLSCNNDSVQLGIGQTAGYSYTWTPTAGLSDPSNSSPTASPNTDINYKLLVDRGVCVDTVNQSVLVDSIYLQVLGDTDICSNQNQITLLANSLGTAQSFQWSNYSDFSDTLNASLSDSSVRVAPTLFQNWYFQRVISNRGCSTIDSSLIRVNNFGVQADSNKSICLGDTVMLKVISLVPGDTLSALWQPYQNIIGPNDTTHIWVNPPSDQQYIVTAENYIRCLTKDSVLVEVSTLDRSSALVTSSLDTIVKGFFTSTLTVSPEGYNYEWTPKTGLSDYTSSTVVANPEQTTTYSVRIYDDEYPECEVSKEVRIVVEEVFCEEPWLFIPNSFSPNGDEVNEVFYFRGRNVVELDFKVYNRWGEEVFRTDNPSIGWTGDYEGEPAPVDVYVYQVRAVCLGGQVFEKKGDVTLVR